MFNEMPVADERHAADMSREPSRSSPQYRIVQCGMNDARRTEAEDFVRSRFRRSHGAHVATFMPTLMLLVDADDRLNAVAGFRSAADEPLFLERYLAVPVEQAISSHAVAPARRAEIIETGNFAAVDSRRAKILMSFMPTFFLGRSARWIVFTATTSIRAILAAMGGHCLEIGAAERDCVAAGADQWGNYYASDPRVMAGYLPSARRIPQLWRPPHGN